jgi:hypothetical protein
MASRSKPKYLALIEEVLADADRLQSAFIRISNSESFLSFMSLKTDRK